MKVILIGHPGSGKTYIADRLSKKIGVMKIDIDVLFDKHPFYFISTALYRKALHKMLEGQREWLIDGYHGKRMPDWLWKSADFVVFVNLPETELRENVIDRYRYKRNVKESTHAQHTSINTLKNFGQIKFRDKSLRNNIERIKSLMDKRSKFIELKSREEIRNFIDSFPLG